MHWAGTWPRPTAEIYGDREPHIASGLDEAARLVIERIASSDALYHDVQHTALVTLCVQDILHGRRIERVVTPSDWAHTILAALAHDIGYVRGVCPGDTPEQFVIDAAGHTVTPPRGASDAFLTPYHVERGKILVRDRFAAVPIFYVSYVKFGSIWRDSTMNSRISPSFSVIGTWPASTKISPPAFISVIGIGPSPANCRPSMTYINC